MIVAQGARRVGELIDQVRQAEPAALPEIARSALLMMGDQLGALEAQIHALERRLLVWHRQNQDSQRLATIPGVGVITATALAASITDPGLFRSGREFAAFLGLVPRQNSSGGKDRLGRISKKGDGYLRKLLVVGATSVIRRVKADSSRLALGAGAARAPPGPRGHRRHGQQDRPDRLGGSNPGRGLPTCRPGLTGIAAARSLRLQPL